MKIGTKSVLFGAHCFLLHPWFVAWAWKKLYGFPWDPRLWVAFFVHDLGYWGKANMDGAEGELHPFFGANLMKLLFDRDRDFWTEGGRWYELCLCHSRFLSKKLERPFSALCVADKLSIVLTPDWLYLPMVNATGEVHEYMKLANPTSSARCKYGSMNVYSDDQRKWYLAVQDYLARWVEEHKDGRNDTWTPDAREAITPEGVWK